MPWGMEQGRTSIANDLVLSVEGGAVVLVQGRIQLEALHLAPHRQQLVLIRRGQRPEYHQKP